MSLKNRPTYNDDQIASQCKFTSTEEIRKRIKQGEASHFILHIGNYVREEEVLVDSFHLLCLEWPDGVLVQLQCNAELSPEEITRQEKIAFYRYFQFGFLQQKMGSTKNKLPLIIRTKSELSKILGNAHYVREIQTNTLLPIWLYFGIWSNKKGNWTMRPLPEVEGILEAWFSEFDSNLNKLKTIPTHIYWGQEIGFCPAILCVDTGARGEERTSGE